MHPWSAIAADLGPAPGSAPHGSWAAAWADAGRVLAEAVAAQGFSWPSGLAVAATVHDALAPDGVLVLGSSNPVRDLDLATAGRHDPHVGVRVHANRGLAGIDGMVSTALGVALGLGRPTHALLGDLTFLHDANGLLLGPDERRPDLTVVVVNDDGGGIFTTLEPGAPERAASFERVFGTPTGTDLAALCRAHGVPHDRARTREDLGPPRRRDPGRTARRRGGGRPVDPPSVPRRPARARRGRPQNMRAAAGATSVARARDTARTAPGASSSTSPWRAIAATERPPR